jgi:prepilin-type N-terminal cleavage/methylation domain-containing protein
MRGHQLGTFTDRSPSGAAKSGTNDTGEHMRAMKRMRDGFTLTELMIVISIFGLVAVLALPNYGRFVATWRLNGEAQQFATVLRTARSSAVMKNIDVIFSFDVDANTYSYFEDMNRDGNHDAGEYQSALYQLPEHVTIAAFTLSNPTLTFGSKGNTRESGTITLRNVLNNTKDIRIYGGTGNVTID